MTSPRLIAATDGSALGNPGPSAWAWAVHAPDGGRPQVWQAGGLGHGTNNEAELTGLLRLLDAVPAHLPMEVRLDSQYVLNIATKWRHGWRRRNWVTGSGTPVKNRELVVAIDTALNTGRDVTFKWVKAHQRAGLGDPLNEFVDAAAQAASNAVAAGRPVNTGPGWPVSR